MNGSKTLLLLDFVSLRLMTSIPLDPLSNDERTSAPLRSDKIDFNASLSIFEKQFPFPSAMSILFMTPKTGPPGTVVTALVEADDQPTSPSTSASTSRSILAALVSGIIVPFLRTSINTVIFNIPSAAPSGMVCVAIIQDEPSDRSSNPKYSVGTFTVSPVVPKVPIISSVDGDFTVGGTIVIIGSNFTGATNVTVNGVPVASFTVDSADQITAILAATVVGTEATVAVQTAAGSSTFNTIVPPPAITAIVPNLVCGGSVVTISGTNFDTGSVATFSFSGQTLPLEILSRTPGTLQVRAVNPVPSDVTVGQVVVTSSSGSSTPVSLTINPAPVISKPITTPATIGQNFTINGLNLGTIGLAVSIGGSEAKVISQTGTSVTIIVPYGIATGPSEVSVTGSGIDCGDTAPLTVLPEPLLITAISPNPVTLTGSSTITITGTGFDVLVPSNNIVHVGTVAATVTSVTADGGGGGVYTIVATLAPQSLTGSQIVTLTVAGQTTTSDVPLVVDASVSSISQPLISESMTIQGYGFGHPGEVVTVTFTNLDNGTISTVSPTSESEDEIVVPVPSVAGRYEFYVTSNGTNSPTYSFELAPIVTNATGSPIAPTGTITIVGAGFAPTVANNTVTIGGVQADVTSVSLDGTSLTAVIGGDTPTGSGIVVQVIINGQPSNIDVTVDVLPLPTISGVTGIFFTGESIVIVGSNFVDVTGVTVNGVAVASFTVDPVDPVDQITAVLAATIDTTEAIVQVTTIAGSASFTVNLTPTITSVTPNPVCGGSSTTLNGSFPASSAVTFTTSGTSHNLPILSQTPTAFEVEVLNFISSTPIVGVVTAGNSSPIGLTINPTPVILTDTPSVATIGQSFTIEGQNLGDPTMQVTVNGVEVKMATQTANSIEIFIPDAVSPGLSTVTVTSGSGCTDSIPVTLLMEPLSVTSVSPNPVTLTASTNITIVGTGFDVITPSNNVVTVGNVLATVVSVTSGADGSGVDTITATLAPATLTGSQSVVVSVDGSDSNSIPLVVGPSVSATSQTSASQPITIQGYGFGYPGEVSTVTFTGPNGSTTTVSPTSESPGEIVVTAPSIAGSYTFYVTSNGIDSVTYALDIVPTVTGATGSPITPTGTITITGTGYDTIATNNMVTIGGAEAKVTSVSPDGTSLTAMIGNDTPVGMGQIVVTVNGQASDDLVSVDVVAPVLSHVTYNPGQPMRIFGSNFTPNTQVIVDGAVWTLPVTYISSTEIRTEKPSTRGDHSVWVRNGNINSDDWLEIEVTTQIYSFQSNPACAGATVVAVGQGYDETSTIVFPNFGSIIPTRWTSTSLQFNVPIGATVGTNALQVVNGDGTQSVTRNLSVTSPAPDPVTITSISSVIGSYTLYSNWSFTVTGTNLLNVTSMTVQGIPVSIVNQTSSSITAQAPILTGSSAFVVLTRSGGCTSTAKVNVYIPPPTPS